MFPLQQNMRFAPGGIFQADVDLFNLLTVGLEGGYLYEKPEATNEGINTAFGGINIGLYYLSIITNVRWSWRSIWR